MNIQSLLSMEAIGQASLGAWLQMLLVTFLFSAGIIGVVVIGLLIWQGIANFYNFLKDIIRGNRW